MKKTAQQNVCIMILLFIMSYIPFSLFSQQSKDGSQTISTAGVIFNRYIDVSASAAAGATTITVSNIANLSASAIAGAANNPYITAALAYGDLIMIIKMQGAAIGTTNTAAYGNITAYNNTGQYELQVVKGVTGNVITLCSALANTYNVSTTERVQVVRIPRLSALTINSGASLTASVWTAAGNTGGIVAIEVTGNASIVGTVTADALGFRGGVVDNSTTGPPGVSNYVNSSSADGGEKGESIAGFEADYDALGGRYDRGAPANGGGGGLAHNSSAGGGANGGNPASWNGMGNPDNSGTNYATAWDLESASFHSNTSSGGGRGGYSYGANSVSPITTAPGNTGWGGDDRRNIGGMGGRPLTYTTTTLFLGGGGGAGDANNSAAVNGANGGGIIYFVVTGTLSGAGTITANGATAGNTFSGNNDAPGGGGGGGAIKLNVQGTISGVTVNAAGGAGGNQGAITNESEGPGGGGGGGYVAVTGTPAITVNVNGGNNGTTASTALTAFTPNGATKGGAGTNSTGNAFVSVPTAVCFALPLTLLSFDAYKDGQGNVQLAWTTEKENMVSRFEGEKSDDGINWQTIGTVSAQNITGVVQHYFLQAGPITKDAFFRLKIIEMDNTFSYSNVRSVSFKSRPISYVNGNNLVLQGLPLNGGEIHVYNDLGILFIQKKIPFQPTTIIDISQLPRGVYFLTWSSGPASGENKFLKL
jgi:hypothetical protein